MSTAPEHVPTWARTARAPAKLNLGLSVGPVRAADARHELVTVMQSLTLADTLTLLPAGAGAQGDELLCDGVDGPPEDNLAARALALFRAQTGWSAPPLLLSVEKRIPVAAGLAGGSADAAATLRLCSAASGGLGGGELLREMAASLGADVPAQLEPGRWLASGAGELLEALPAPVDPVEVLLLPSEAGLATAAVYAEADRLGLPRPREELEARRSRLALELSDGAPLPVGELLENDLQDAAVSLCPEISAALEQARAAGAAAALVCGSGPTVAALFGGAHARDRLDAAEQRLAARTPPVIRCRSVVAGFGAPLRSWGTRIPGRPRA